MGRNAQGHTTAGTPSPDTWLSVSAFLPPWAPDTQGWGLQPCFVLSVPVLLLLGQARPRHQCKEANDARMLALFPDPTLPNWLHK